MTQVGPDLHIGALSALHLGPKEITCGLKVAAVVQWRAEGRVAESKASEMPGIIRAELLHELSRRRMPACQVTPDELCEEISRV